MKTITIEIPDGKKAEWVNGVLTLVDEAPKDITERIKTFEDAVEWCYKNGKEYLVSNYEGFAITYSASHIASADILAYLKLRIITCALNEGWEPKFDGEEKRCYGWYLAEDGIFIYKKKTNSYRTGTSTDSSSKLVFKSEALAEYAAKQFKDEYMKFSYKRN